MDTTSVRSGSGADSRIAPVDARVLGAGTALRFALLLVLILTSSVSMLRTMVPGARDETERYFQCRLAAGFDPADAVLDAPTLLRGSDALNSCMSGHRLAILPWLLLTAGVLVLAFAIFWLFPAWKSRGGRLAPVDSLPAGELHDELQGLVRAARLSRAPRFVIDPVAATPSAVVFGRLRRYTVCLHGGLLARRATDPDGFRGVVLHELAHIRNRDVDVTYATVALWRAFLLGVLVPHLVLTVHPTLGRAPLAASLALWQEQWSLGLRGVFRTTVLIALVYLIRADILRTREIYADVDAAGWGAGAEGWQSPADRKHRTGRAVQVFLDLWRTHPRWADRRKSLVDPSTLFGASALLMFLTGTAAILAGNQLGSLNNEFGVALGNSAAWLIAALVTGIAGVALWRSVAHAVLTSRPAPSGVRAGLWLGTGLAVGELLTFRTAGLGWLPARPEVLLVLVAGVAVLTWWVTQCAELWIRTSRGRSIRPMHLLGLLATLSVFGTGFAYWMGAAHLLMGGPLWSPEWVLNRYLADIGFSWTQWAAVVPPLYTLLLPHAVALISDPLVLAGSGVLWLFPLVAWMRRPVTHAPPWMRSALSQRQGHEAPGEQLPSLRRLAKAAALGGALCCAGTALVMLGLHPLQPPLGQRTPIWVMIYLSWLQMVMVAGACVTAACVSARAHRYRMVFALGAAGGAVLIGLTGHFLLAATDGCITPMAVMLSSCGWRPRAAWYVVTASVPFVLGLGMYLVAISALGGAIVARLAGQLMRRRWSGVEHRERGSEGAIARPISVISMAARRICIGTACVAVVALMANTAVSYWQANSTAQENSTAEDPANVSFASSQPSASTVKQQVQAWLTVGGATLVEDFRSDFNALTDAAHASAEAAEAQGRARASIDPAVYGPICADLEEDAKKATAFMPIPDARAQPLWKSMVSHFERGGANCQRALTQNDSDLFRTAMDELLAAQKAYLQLQQLL